MKKIAFTLICLIFNHFSFSQEANIESKFDKNLLLKELAENACKCIDSIETFDKIRDTISAEINRCINDKVGAYQMGCKISGIKDLEKDAEEVNGKKQINISIDINPNSNEFKKYYYEMEKYLMSNCDAIKMKIKVNDKVNSKSISNNREALKYYNLGLDESKKENFEKAIDYFKKATVFDTNFAFAYDNIGICSRRLNRFDDAIDAYEKSLEIDPNGTMPLQNIAIAYIFKKEYKKGVKSYEKLAKIEPDNPEVFYGIGNICTNYLFDYEKALDNLCQAYNIYTQQKSPYRTDAEKLIHVVYTKLKEQGKESLFNQILEKHNISQN